MTDEATGVFNVACGEETSLNALFQMIRGELSRLQPTVGASKPTYSPPRLGDIRRSLADIGRIRQVLGFAPRYRPVDGLREALEWYVARSSQPGLAVPSVR
jgi:UDP-N-acetylglucosamine 4-epimerase